jgi:hypothetical protein
MQSKLFCKSQDIPSVLQGFRNTPEGNKSVTLSRQIINRYLAINIPQKSLQHPTTVISRGQSAFTYGMPVT